MKEDPSLEEIDEIVERLYQRGGLSEPYEASFAVCSGWDPQVFRQLYTAYIDSIGVDLKKQGNRTTELKGAPLEAVARYFLERGGIAKNVLPGGIQEQWTVDGIGDTHMDRFRRILGVAACEKCGSKLYMEAKNHRASMGPEDWAQHGNRMRRHECKLGVVFSTGGYRLGRGQGYMREIFQDFSLGTVHILFSVADLARVAKAEAYPWTVFKDAYRRVSDDTYELSEVQNAYSTQTCLQIAQSEHKRLHP